MYGPDDLPDNNIIKLPKAKKKIGNVSDISINAFKPLFTLCKKCVYWERKKTNQPHLHTPKSQNYGECRIVPPALIPDSAYGVWPLTMEEHWCGEGETSKDYLSTDGKDIEFEPSKK
tara:strand:+ start:455 stop:805 length:351 start_codon:yes stop_codon:yes gene_type:complete